MSLYNILFGTNPYTPILKWILKLDLPNGYTTGRFRDIYVNEDGTKIILYTRNGGGNRECWKYEGCGEEKGTHAPECIVTTIKHLREHPNYLRDYDDDFDCTYAYFEFSVPDKHLEITKALATGEKPKDIHEKFSEVIKEIETIPKEQLEKDERFKPIITVLKHIMEGSEKNT